VGQNGARRFLDVEFGTGCGAGPAEVGVSALHLLKFVVDRFLVESRQGMPGRRSKGKQ
jgi:hypothetical protein